MEVAAQAEHSLEQSRFVSKVFAWMALGMTITAGVAWYVAGSQAALDFIFSSPAIFYGLMVLQLAEVLAFGFLAKRISAAGLGALFIAYSATLGVSLSVIFLVYELGSIGGIFLITAGLFAVMAVIGYTTKRDLTKMGSLAIMLLIGVILASIVNLFLNNTVFDLVISWVTVVIFVGLTAYDMQKIKAMAAQTELTAEDTQKAVLFGALSLYLDFINLFLSLLRIFGRRR